ncbi:hypothetical protein GLAREA_00565 [Glarea lozoyensis ATCC 20868]|uniref:Uncharacterized protein n=1 Tax=Glarea lozoyensis (strain ATCC 20868 / MF5171) TaxID=1116229 RepID=S3CUT7_GLAL2|nr:uncharacterized protein GLAREA_00565 [Glarea lozoyensis ATCC 20868]EPE29405.1 hypothetical protein GLAREA_00565 [Glarea lozoyensis ATCC 20868]
MSSSPDPLNDSPTFHGHLIARRTSLNARRGSISPSKQHNSSQRPIRHSSQLELLGSSPKKQTFELDVGDRITPHKIRVTVEAGSSDGENGRPEDVSPMPTRRVRTTTTRVPVKGLEDEDENAATPKRGRGRPRKSMGTPIPVKARGRAGTPKGKRARKTFGGGNEEDGSAMLEIGGNVEVGRGQSRSVSRARKAPHRKAGPFSDDISTTIPRPRRTRRKSISKDHDVISEKNGSSSRSSVDEAVSRSTRDTDRSTYPVVGSSAIEDAEVGDVVIARFHPGDETPRRTGWSSPRIADQSNIPSQSNDQHISNLSNDIYEQNEEESTAASSRRGSISLHSIVDQGMDDGYEKELEVEEEADDEAPREFDTIMESEGFSMISVDSVQSLQEIRSSPWIQADVQQPENLIRNKSLLSIVETHVVEENSFSIIPEEILEAASPKKTQKTRVQNTTHEMRNLQSTREPDNSTRKSHVSRLLAKKATRMEDSFSSIAPEILEAATPKRVVQKKASMSSTIKNDPLYEDSFSAIPGSILEAATPAAKRTTIFEKNGSTQKTVASSNLIVTGSKKSLFPSQVVNATSPRLLTPEETPSPTSDSMPSKVVGSATEVSIPDQELSAHGNPSGEEAPPADSYMASSPPSVAPRRYTYTAHLRQHRNMDREMAETPAITFSSPSLPPPIQLPKLQTGLAHGLPESRRPTLSPIARTGQILQDVIVPLSSPRSRSQSLGSPFKSPAASRTSSSATRGSQNSPSQQERDRPKVSLSANIATLSSHNSNWTRSSSHEDPFSNSTRAHRSPSLHDKEQYTLELPCNRVPRDQTGGSQKSRFESLRSEDAMSWQPEEEIDLSNRSAAAMSKLTSEQRWAAERAEVSKQISSADRRNVIVIGSDVDDGLVSGHDEDEDFDLLLETMGSSSPHQSPDPPQETVPHAPENLEKPRRSKIPSPWRKNSKRLVYSDEVSQFSELVEKEHAIAGNVIEDADMRPVTARRTIIRDQPVEDSDLDLSGWQIPQKSNFKPRGRSDSGAPNLSVLLGGDSPPKLPVISTRSSQVERKPSSSYNKSGNDDTVEAETNQQRDKASFTPIPQKMGFAPKTRIEASAVQESSPRKSVLFGDVAQKEANPLFQSRANIPVVNATISGIASSSQGPYDGSSSLRSSVEKENREIGKRTLKWTETIQLPSNRVTCATSPSKSCLRSPLKTPTASRPSPFESPSKAVAFVSSSPAPRSPKQPLSATTWSKDHWLLLESIMKTHKPSKSPNSGSGSSDVSNQSRRRNSTRVISKLLGRTVRSEGESLVLEQWHLEVVDEFRGLVAGWEEKVVAMRVFALIKGGERRDRTTEGEVRGSRRVVV